jgi:hypothetical protein
MRRAIKITIVLALLAVPSGALAANTSQPQAINCQSLKFKPQRITLSCGDGGTWLGKLKWSSWTNTQAVANGNFTANNCSPSCVAGKTLEKRCRKKMKRKVTNDQMNKIWVKEKRLKT